jgi:hypothetical protein
VSELERESEETAYELDGYRPQSRDADAVFERRLFAEWGVMDAVHKAELIDSMSRDAHELALVGARLRHPSASERELEMRAFALRLGRDLMVRVYGWDPEVQGW